jgi:hypothetical protein
MKLIKGEFWEAAAKSDVILVTTNGIVRKDGKLVMGGGIALQFAEKFPSCPLAFGKLVSSRGNVPHLISRANGPHLLSNPTKRHYRDPSPLDLVYESACKIKQIVDAHGFSKVLSTPPGCGLGGLHWEEVEPVLQRARWDSRFTVITF